MEEEISQEEIQGILEENNQLIKVIVKCQREGRVMDAMLYQTRLQLNLVHLASVADNRPAPSSGIPPSRSGDQQTEPEENLPLKAQLTKFVNAVSENSLKSIPTIARITGIPIEKIVPLANAYIAFLKRQNRFTEATRFENELAMNGVEK